MLGRQRGLLAGIVVVALAVAAGLFWYERPAAKAPPAASEVAPRPVFVGTRQIGAWTLRCRDRSLDARSAQTSRTVANKYQSLQQPSFASRAPARRCAATAVLEKGADARDTILANLVLRGPRDVLFLIVRVPESLVPQAAAVSGAGPPSSTGAADGSAKPSDPGASVDFVWDGRHANLPVAVCRPIGCAAIARFLPAEEARLTSAQSLAIGLPASSGRARRMVTVPVAGLAEALSALKKLE
jgi:invasion protein IalB